ncbi:MAG TPA: CopG family transcriptional regulator [Actinomycetota bacterium]|nr:CopG family transcriptional regulator [Actinomycetota bacterium]
MIRTQMQLREDQVRALKRRAAERGVSMAELIRDAVDRELERDDEEAKWERAFAVMGKFRSGLADVSERHDDYLAEAYLE